MNTRARRLLGVLLLSVAVILLLFEANLLPFATNIETLTPIGDTMTRETAGDYNYGDSDSLMVGVIFNPGFGRMRSYFKFQLSSLQGIISSAKLNLYCIAEDDGLFPYGVANFFEIHKISDAWQEDTLTWDTQPVLDPTSISLGTLTLSPETWHTWDVSEYVREQVQGDKTVSFLLKTSYESGGPEQPSYNSAALFASKESDFSPFLEITISNDAPVAVITVPKTNYQIFEIIPFSASSSADPDGWITTYQWDFGDGQTASGSDVSHQYSTPNTFNVKLTVTDNYDLTNEATKTMTIVDTLTATISPESASIDLGGSVAFSVTIAGGTPNYFVEWLVNGIQKATGNAYAFIGTDLGQHNIVARVTDSQSRSTESNIATVYVSSAPTDTGTLKIVALNNTSHALISVSASLVGPLGVSNIAVTPSGYVDSEALIGNYLVYATLNGEYSEVSGYLNKDEQLILTLEFGDVDGDDEFPYKLVAAVGFGIAGIVVILYPIEEKERKRK